MTHLDTPAPPTAPDLGMDISGLDQVYDRLALAIDQAGPDKSDTFLVTLAMLHGLEGFVSASPGYCQTWLAARKQALPGQTGS